MSRAVLSLGANVGDPLAALRFAVAALRERVEVVAVSPVYETVPLGGPPQDNYRNAILLVETALAPAELLTLAHEIEDSAGRVRAERWGPRTLDIDIVAYDDVVSEQPMLPHPRAHERAFVLAPWLDVDADAALPQGRVAELLHDARGEVRRTDETL